MVSPEFSRKVKHNVGRNFDQSLSQYQAFESRYRFFADLCLHLAQWIDLKPDTDVLDVGCGNGVSAAVLNQHFGCRVLGVDLSPTMVAAGNAVLDGRDARLVVGDGEALSALVAGRRFDYVLYNASIFIFPDVPRTIREAVQCLRPAGKIAFSFYPCLAGPADEDLMTLAFQNMGMPPPRSRVITAYEDACRALAAACGPVAHHRWVQPLDIDFMIAFFSIPAQSASLFPGCDYEQRRQKVRTLFDRMADLERRGTVVWRMAQAACTPDNR